MQNLPALAARFAAVRQRTLQIVESLSPEDQQIQAFEYASPTKWHLAHTTWFIEHFILERFADLYRVYDPSYAKLFNSYYEALGTRHPRAARGVLSRPSVAEVLAFRRHVDEHVQTLLSRSSRRWPADLEAMLELGIAHEEQHQELILTDILANFSVHPSGPAWRNESISTSSSPRKENWIAMDGGLVTIGMDVSEASFSFDHEGPAHRVFIAPFELAYDLLTNVDMLEFMADGGYQRPELWLSDGLDWVRKHSVTCPRYWQQENGGWQQMTLYGLQPLDSGAPLCHINAYEADALATWKGARLPTEFEWEYAAGNFALDPADGRYFGTGLVTPIRAVERGDEKLRGMWGELWQWTRSAFLPYPGFRPHPGAVGEYNGKFMNGQWVLRGGSCATPPHHMRRSYRNFFYPEQNWQFTGVRLARDPISST